MRPISRRSLIAGAAGAAVVPRAAKALNVSDVINTVLLTKSAEASGSVLIPNGSSRMPFEEPLAVNIMPNFPPAVVNNILNLGPIPPTTRSILGAFTFNMLDYPSPAGFAPLAYNLDLSGQSSMEFSIVGPNVPIPVGSGKVILPNPALVAAIRGTAANAQGALFIVPNIIDVGGTIFQTVIVYIRALFNGKWIAEVAMGRQGYEPTLLPSSSIFQADLSGFRTSVDAFDIPLRTMSGVGLFGLTYGVAQLIGAIGPGGKQAPFAPREDPGRFSFPGLIAQTLLIPSPNVANLETILATEAIIDSGSRPVVLPPNGMIFPGSPSPPLTMLMGDRTDPGGFNFHLGNNFTFYDYGLADDIAFAGSASYQIPQYTISNDGTYPIYYSPLVDPAYSETVIIENISIDPTD